MGMLRRRTRTEFSVEVHDLFPPICSTVHGKTRCCLLAAVLGIFLTIRVKFFLPLDSLSVFSTLEAQGQPIPQPLQLTRNPVQPQRSGHKLQKPNKYVCKW